MALSARVGSHWSRREQTYSQVLRAQRVAAGGSWCPERHPELRGGLGAAREVGAARRPSERRQGGWGVNRTGRVGARDSVAPRLPSRANRGAALPCSPCTAAAWVDGSALGQQGQPLGGARSTSARGRDGGPRPCKRVRHDVGQDVGHAYRRPHWGGTSTTPSPRIVLRRVRA